MLVEQDIPTQNVSTDGTDRTTQQAMEGAKSI